MDPAGGPQAGSSGQWASHAGASSGEQPYRPWWWTLPASERGVWAAAKLTEGWGAAASQLLAALQSIPLSSLLLLALTLYLANHVRCAIKP